MLVSITLRNLATISDASLEFDRGLNVLTGETGSGKSILIDGLMLATGKRADRSMVRPGAKTAFVEAVFSGEDREETMVRREISLKGRSRIFIDDSLATLDDVRDHVRNYVELHSQRSTPDLLRPREQLLRLDRFAGHEALREECCSAFNELKGCIRELEKVEGFLAGSSGNREVLLHEMSLFEEFRPELDDYLNLSRREMEIRSAVTQAELFSRVMESLDGEDGLCSQVHGLRKALMTGSSGNEQLTELLDQAGIALGEASMLVSRKLQEGEEAPELMRPVEERLDGYSRLMARFGGTIESVIEAGRNLRSRLSEYDEAAERKEVLQRSIEELTSRVALLSGRLTAGRKKAGAELSVRAVEEMRSLNMPWAEFTVSLTGLPDGLPVNGRNTGPYGADRAVFMFSANRGMPSDTLDAVASGGEMSRVALALALAMAERASPSTLIFDEIDAGTGGETAHHLAESLLRSSLNRQVIVISHLAQIAARAHRHLAVEKELKGTMPVTTVRNLKAPEARAEELARLLGGGEGARDHARKLLEVT